MWITARKSLVLASPHLLDADAHGHAEVGRPRDARDLESGQRTKNPMFFSYLSSILPRFWVRQADLQYTTVP